MSIGSAGGSISPRRVYRGSPISVLDELVAGASDSMSADLSADPTDGEDLDNYERDLDTSEDDDNNALLCDYDLQDAFINESLTQRASQGDFRQKVAASQRARAQQTTLEAESYVKELQERLNRSKQRARPPPEERNGGDAVAPATPTRAQQVVEVIMETPEVERARESSQRHVPQPRRRIRRRTSVANAESTGQGSSVPQRRRALVVESDDSTSTDSLAASEDLDKDMSDFVVSDNQGNTPHKSQYSSVIGFDEDESD